MNIIDPHIHLFTIERGQYQWLTPENPPYWPDKSIIYKNFEESELTLSEELLLNGFVHIEAGFNNEQPWKEIEWLESTCKSEFRSVACIDLTMPTATFINTINKLVNYKSVVGCRHILDEDAVNILTNTNTLENFKILAKYNLSFDLQMPLDDNSAVTLLSNIIEAVPTLRVIINHAGWPNIEENKPCNKNWLNGLKKLSTYKYCAIKCSGWEMSNRNYSALSIINVINACISTFGYKRVMIGSNFPLCLFTLTYQEFWQLNAINIANKLHITPHQLKYLCSLNASHWYKF